VTAIADDLHTLLACPRCATALRDLHCPACRVSFPALGGVPWLFADPGAAVTDWRNRWQLTVQRLRAEAAAADAALTEARHDAARIRLRTLADGYRAQIDHLQSVLAPLIDAPGAPLDSLLALRTRLPPTQGILSYDGNVFRDWIWGTAETERARDAVLTALAGHVPQRVLVLGAGAGRLAYDLHGGGAQASTVALDFSPLLAAVCQRVGAGETVSLVEFPLAPLQPDRAAIRRDIRAPQAARQGFYTVLGDARFPPFRAGAFDVVITPWLLDVIDAPVAETLKRINVLLTEGGVWVNQGSIAFEHADPARRLTLPELEAETADAGFAAMASHEETVPYMDNPDSRHGRRERIVTSSARKSHAVPPPPRHRSLPEWITEPGRSVPALPAFLAQAGSTKIHAYIMSLIDGKRSLEDIARVLEQHQLMSRDDALPSLRGFMTRMWEEAEVAPRL
jgi:SAM-dependent methyltransferase